MADRRRLRLGSRKAYLLTIGAMGWQPILSGAADQLLTEQLISLGLVKVDGHLTKGVAWSFRPTPMGEALGVWLHRETGGKLRRPGVALLARYRSKLRERFDVPAAVTGLRAYVAKMNAERDARDPSSARPVSVGALYHPQRGARG